MPSPTLTASAITNTSATLTRSHHTGTWYYKANAAPHNTCSSAQTGNSVSLTSLSASTSYTYKAYSDSTCSTELTSAATDAELTTAANTTTTLSADMVTTGGARLQISNRTGSWYYKSTASGASCSAAQTGSFATLTGLTANTSYTHKAYSDSSCTTEIGSATFTTKIAGPTGTSMGVDVSYDKTYGNTASGWPLVNLTYDASKPLTSGVGTTGTCATGTTFESGWYRTNALTTLVGTKDFLSRATVSAPVKPGDYQLLAYCTKGTGMSKVYSAPVNLMGTNGKVSIRCAVAVSLSAVTLSPTVARLEIGNYTGEWWHKFTLPSSGATCTSASVFPTD